MNRNVQLNSIQRLVFAVINTSANHFVIIRVVQRCELDRKIVDCRGRRMCPQCGISEFGEV